MSQPMTLDEKPRTERLINELQSYGVRLVDPKAGIESRRGGAGPSDHKAMTIDGVTVMVPVHTAPAFESPYVGRGTGRSGRQPRLARWRPTGSDQLPEATALLRPDHRGRHPIFQDCGAAWPRCPRNDGPADLHPLSEPDEDLPVLCDRPVARRGPHDRAQDAGPACRRRQGRRRTRWCPAHGADDRHTTGQRPRCRDPDGKRTRHQSGGGTCRSRASANHPTTISGSAACTTPV